MTLKWFRHRKWTLAMQPLLRRIYFSSKYNFWFLIGPCVVGCQKKNKSVGRYNIWHRIYIPVKSGDTGVSISRASSPNAENISQQEWHQLWIISQQNLRREAFRNPVTSDIGLFVCHQNWLPCPDLHSHWQTGAKLYNSKSSWKPHGLKTSVRIKHILPYR